MQIGASTFVSVTRPKAKGDGSGLVVVSPTSGLANMFQEPSRTWACPQAQTVQSQLSFVMST